MSAPEGQVDEVLAAAVQERVRALLDTDTDVAPAADALDEAIDRMAWKALSAKVVELWGRLADAETADEMVDLAARANAVKRAQHRVALMCMGGGA